MDTAVEMPLSQKLNVRLIVLLTTAGALFAFIGYRSIDYVLSHGIHHHNAYDDVDLKSLGSFVFNADTGTDADIPPHFRALDGKRVQLEGFMASPKAAGRQLHDFQFVYNVQICCFNGPPLVQERVFARVPQGGHVPFIDGFTRLTGILHVKVEKQDGVTQSVYTMEVESAEPIT